MRSFWVVFICGMCLSSCTEFIDYYNLPSKGKGRYYNAVVELGAGTNRKFEYNKITGKFEQDFQNGKPRVISYLPYPGNYGFIPSTLSDKSMGGDGDALDVLFACNLVVFKDEGELCQC
jgi:inorganic pyrophosphatase